MNLGSLAPLSLWNFQLREDCYVIDYTLLRTFIKYICLSKLGLIIPEDTDPVTIIRYPVLLYS